MAGTSWLPPCKARCLSGICVLPDSSPSSPITRVCPIPALRPFLNTHTRADRETRDVTFHPTLPFMLTCCDGTASKLATSRAPCPLPSTRTNGPTEHNTDSTIKVYTQEESPSTNDLSSSDEDAENGPEVEREER